MMDSSSKKPYLVVIFIQIIYAGMYVISKAAIDQGLKPSLFIFYRQAAATVMLTPLAFIFERKRAPPVSFKIMLKVFMHALIGITLSLNVYNIALSYTSATVASATTNSVPVLTFFLALLFRMETIKLKSLAGISKMSGITLCIAGIMIIAFYQGPSVSSFNHHHAFSHETSSNSAAIKHSKATWIKGTFFLLSSNTTWSLWLVLQGVVLKEYPSKLLLTTLQCFFSALQSFGVAFVLERDFAKWKLKLDTGLLAIAYCGFLVTGVSFYLQTWCIEKKGPVFLAISTPLALVFTIFCSSFFLGEVVSLGSIIGGLLMVGGLYSVLWGKNQEISPCEETMKRGERACVEQNGTASSSIDNV